jgi:HK97 family phage major capsid protein
VEESHFDLRAVLDRAPVIRIHYRHDSIAQPTAHVHIHSHRGALSHLLSQYIAGTGVGEPQGVLNAPCQVAVTRNTGSKVLHIDVVNMLTRLLPASLPRACWLASPDVMQDLLQLYLAVGSPTTQALPPPGWLTFDGSMWRLVGLPLYVSEHVSALRTEGDLILADFSMYLLGTRALMQLEISPHYLFASDVSAIKIRSRVDGRMWPQNSLAPASSSATAGARSRCRPGRRRN